MLSYMFLMLQSIKKLLLLTMITSNILEKLRSLDVSSREELTGVLRNIIANRLERVIETHNTASVIFIFTDTTKLLIKAEFGSDTATHREIAWYNREEVKKSQASAKYIDSHNGENYALLLLEFVEGSKTIDELVMSGFTDPSLICSYVRKAIDTDRALFNQTRAASSVNEVDAFYQAKYLARRQESDSIPFLRDLFSNPSIQINGKEYLTPDAAMERIKTTPRLLERLTPTEMGLIHGDLHSGNILTKDGDIFLIDPNGNPMMPLEYDIGKIFHSVHGNYGSIMKGSYSLQQKSPASFLFSLDHPVSYDAVFADLCQYIEREELLRSLYAEALHFATMLPHHAANENETVALFLRCVQLFDDLLKLTRSR